MKIRVSERALYDMIQERVTEWVGIRVMEYYKHKEDRPDQRVIDEMIDASVDGAMVVIAEVFFFHEEGGNEG